MSAVRMVDGGLTLPARTLSGVELVAQRLAVRLSTVRGTWPEDDAFGLPLDRWIDRPGLATPGIIAAAVREQLARDPAVLSVVGVEYVAVGAGEVRGVARVIVRVDGEQATVSVPLSPLVRVGAPLQLAATGRSIPMVP